MEVLGHVQLPQREGAADGGKKRITIMQLTDVHRWIHGEPEFHHPDGNVTNIDGTRYSVTRDMEYIKRLLVDVKPDVVMLTGDIIDGRPFQGKDKDAFLPIFAELADAIHRSGALWSFVPGNHDSDHAPWTTRDLLAVYDLPGCLSHGATSFNHTLTVGHEATPDRSNATRLFLFDTGGNHEVKKWRYHVVDKAAVEAYSALSHNGSLDVQGQALLGTAWYHIPLDECTGLLPVAGENRLFEMAVHARAVPFPLAYQPFRCMLNLAALDRVVGSSKLPCRLFRAMAEAGNVQATFFGHDHFSDAVFLKDRIFMCYGRCGAHTPPIDWEGKGGEVPFDRYSARICEFVCGTATKEPQMLTYIFEKDSPHKDLVIMSADRIEKYAQHLRQAERARRCALGFFFATVLIGICTLALAIYVFGDLLAADDSTGVTVRGGL